jgi:hypothetical protein
MEYLDLFLKYFSPLIISAVSVALLLLARKVLTKYEDKLSTDSQKILYDFINAIILSGVQYAEQWAKNRLKESGEKPPSNDKLHKALEFIVQQLQSHGIINLTEQEIIRRVESTLGANEVNRKTFEEAVESLENEPDGEEEENEY